MNLYELIKNPIETDEDLENILEVYSRSKHGLYYNLVQNDDNIKLSNEQKNEYYNNFMEYIVFPAINDVFNEIKKVPNYKINIFKKKIDDKIEALEKKAEEYKKKNGFSDWKIQDQIIDIKNSAEYSVKEIDKISKKCSAEEFCNFFINHFVDYAEYQHDILSNTKDISEEEIAKKHNLSMDDVKKVKLFYNILNAFDGGNEVMGFHINNGNLKFQEKNTSSEMKFYINAGKDTYKFANEFWNKCNERNLNDFYFKVVDPFKGEYNRNDKMCVYMAVDKAPEYIEILRALKEELPDLDYQKPMCLTGKIDGWIGVGADPEKSSYNSQRSKLIQGAIDNYLKNHNLIIEKEKVYDYFKGNKEKLAELRNEIISEIDGKDICKDNIAINAKYVNKYKNIKISESFSKESRSKEEKETNNNNKDIIIEKDKKEEKKDVGKEDIDRRALNKEKNVNKNEVKDVNSSYDKVMELVRKIIKDNVYGNNKEYLKNSEKLDSLIHELYVEKAKKTGFKETTLEMRMNERQLSNMVSDVIRTTECIVRQSKLNNNKPANLVKEANYCMNKLKSYFTEEDFKKEKVISKFKKEKRPIVKKKLQFVDDDINR